MIASAFKRLIALRAQAPFIPRAFRLVWEPAASLTVAWFALLVLQGVLPAAYVYLTKAAVDGFVHVVDSGGTREAIRTFLIPAGLMGLALLAQELVAGIDRWVRNAQAIATVQYIEELVQRKSIAVDLAFYDSPEYYDRLHRAKWEAASTPLELLTSSGRLLQNLITLAAISGLLLTYGWWLPVIIVLGTLPGLYVALSYVFAEHELSVRRTPEIRQSWYYNDLLTSTSYAPEVRLFGIGERYIALYRQLKGALSDERLQLMRRSVALELVASGIGVLLMALTLVWFGARAIQGQYTLGDLALLFQAYGRGQDLLRTLHASIGAVYRNMLYLSDLFAFLDMEPLIKPPQTPAAITRTLRHSIRFNDVTFAYPGTDRAALRHFNLEILAGTSVAIVGENGAGKSTLAKLLCRFYDPQDGCITIDGVDIREMPLEPLRAMFSMFFQQPVQYYDTVAANVSVSTAHTVEDRESIRRAIGSAGADEIVGRLDDGYDTRLGRWFAEGTDLSAGEWQRIALARAYLREAPILVLDEPTSAMDPWSEAEWLLKLRELERTRTTVIISHRFSVAMHATRIHVVHNGEIVESGTHAELIARNGKYAAGWNTLLVEAG